MSLPLFSCVIPVKGPRPYFKEALSSLESQGFGSDLEIIIQDADVESDSGQSDALNKGFAKSHGKWLFWLNADDILLQGALSKVKELVLRTTGDQWFVGNQLLIDDKSSVLRCSVGNKWNDGLYKHAVPHVYGPSAFFTRELFERVGGFDVTLKYCMDWDLWIKFMKAGAKFERINEYLWAQRQWSGSKTQRRLSVDELKEHLAEVDRMCEANDFKITAEGVWRTRLARLFGGCYMREFVDGLRLKGKKV